MVQTQDLGPQYRSIETTIYKKGLLLQRRRFDYGPLLGRPDLRNTLADKMESMHGEALRDIRAGKLASRR